MNPSESERLLDSSASLAPAFAPTTSPGVNLDSHLARLGSALRGPQGRMLEIRKYALHLLMLHGLADWNFRYNKRKRSMGQCVYGRRTIELSLYFASRNGAAEILDTLLHEIAHALVGPRHGHDAVWKKKCLEIGATPRCCATAVMPSGRWQANCGQCDRRFDRHRRPKRMKGWYCPDCGPFLGKLVWRSAGNE